MFQRFTDIFRLICAVFGYLRAIILRPQALRLRSCFVGQALARRDLVSLLLWLMCVSTSCCGGRMKVLQHHACPRLIRDKPSSNVIAGLWFHMSVSARDDMVRTVRNDDCSSSWRTLASCHAREAKYDGGGPSRNLVEHHKSQRPHHGTRPQSTRACLVNSSTQPSSDHLLISSSIILLRHLWSFSCPVDSAVTISS